MFKNFSKKEQEPGKPLGEYLYTGQYPDMDEFEKPWESCIQVNQGDGKISLDCTPLQSERFSKCCVLILQSAASLEAALFHISDIDLDYRQRAVLSQLTQGSKFDVLFLRGTISRDLRVRITGSRYFPDNVSVHRVLKDIEFDTGEQHWDIVYKPNERRVYLNSRSQKKVLVFEV